DVARQPIQGLEPSGNEHRRPQLREQDAADPDSTFRNGSLGQDPLDVLFGLARSAARVAKNDVGMKEMMIAGGPIRARIPLRKWVHLKFHFSCRSLGRVDIASLRQSH